MIPITLLTGLVLTIALGVAGVATCKRAIIVAAAMVAMLAAGCLGIVLLANSPLWPM